MRHEILRFSGVPAYRIGPYQDDPLFDGLDVTFADAANAKFIICTGLNNEEDETPKDYEDELAALAARGLPMICG